MRNIRVRGWHTTNKKMFSPEEMAEDQLTLLPTGCFINVHGGSTKMSQIFPVDKFIPMLSTGLKDKNGVEIYEGDILLTENKTPPRRLIWLVFWSKNEDVNMWGWMCETETRKYILDDSLQEKGEVIGNIHEHGELLK